MLQSRIIPILATLTAFGACSPGGARLDTRTFALHYLRAPEAEMILKPYVFTDRPGAQGVISPAEGSITIRETPDNLDKIARVLAEYDRPRPLIRLTVHLIQADGAAQTDSTIADVEATLRKLFRFRGYRLVEEGIFSTTEDGVVQQQLGAGAYSIEVRVHRVAGAGDSATVPLEVHLFGRNLRFSTEVGIPAGKTAVLGNVGEDPRGTLILTVRPELITASP
ncbi:MAG TPA: hypothetical protein VMH88_06715 [Gemmatimonadales bacterium]|nr:hypothetical protein [Gemmatimonadales bacterium]